MGGLVVRCAVLPDGGPDRRLDGQTAAEPAAASLRSGAGASASGGKVGGKVCWGLGNVAVPSWPDDWCLWAPSLSICSSAFVLCWHFCPRIAIVAPDAARGLAFDQVVVWVSFLLIFLDGSMFDLTCAHQLDHLLVVLCRRTEFVTDT